MDSETGTDGYNKYPNKKFTWTFKNIVCYPCHRVNIWLDDLVAEKAEVEEILSFDYSSGESAPSDAIIINRDMEYYEMSKD